MSAGPGSPKGASERLKAKEGYSWRLAGQGEPRTDLEVGTGPRERGQRPQVIAGD